MDSFGALVQDIHRSRATSKARTSLSLQDLYFYITIITNMSNCMRDLLGTHFGIISHLKINCDHITHFTIGGVDTKYLICPVGRLTKWIGFYAQLFIKMDMKV